MRDRETIDSELRRIALSRRSVREQGGQPSCQRVDELLDERLGHRPAETEAVDAGLTNVAETRSEWDKTESITSSRRKGVLRRVGPLAALPLSLVTVIAVVVAIFAVHGPHPPEQPTVVPPPSSAEPKPMPPKAQAPPIDIVDRAFIDALKQNGVPVPSHDYATIHGHAVCDFLTHQHNVAEAVRFVEGSSIWDANQSADFTAGAIVSYCPQYEPAGPEEMQPGFQKTLSDLQAIQGDLKGIEGDLQGIQGGLQNLPGYP
jgi:hypothetical protein